jgi:hypothetical protein
LASEFSIGHCLA